MRFLQTIAGLRQPARLDSFCCVLAIACLAWYGGSETAWASQATVTTLSLTSGGNAVSSVAGGTAVTLTATVLANGAALKLGQVNFCDATAASCTDIHLLGTAQLTSAGTAVLAFHPGPGAHRYDAVFLGALNDGASASATIGLTVAPQKTGPQTTYTVASISGPVATNTYGTYALTANVGTKGTVPPAGTVSFSGTNVATGNGFSLPGTATLGPPSGSPGFLNVPIPKLNTGSADAPPLIAVADFNGDGFPDIVSAPNGGIAVSLGKGDGTFAAPLIPNVDPVDGINAFGVGDFNGDGITDLLIDDEDTGQLTVLLGKGDGTFTIGQSMPYSATSIAVTDFNGDGKPDISLPGPTILLGNGDGTFTAAPNSPQTSSSQIVAADFNGDGKIDLATSGGEGNTVTILLGNGDGTFTAAPSQTQLVASKLVVADFNGDGKIDLATLDSVGGTLAVLLGIGDGTFNAPTPLPADSNFSASTLAVGDFNGDGKPDVAVTAAANTASITPDAKVSIFAGNGDGTFGARSDVGFNVVTGAIGLTSLAAADLTGSGSSDLATFGSVFLGNLTITTATANYVLPFGDSMIQADYPGDANNAPSNSTNGPAVFVPQQSFSLTSNPVAVAPGASTSGNFSVTSLTFSGTLNLSCSIPVPQGQANPPACSVQPTVFIFSPGGMENLAYTVSTQATTPPGQYTATITATYAFGGVTPASTYATVTVAGQNYLLTNSGATISSPGASGNSTITISPTGGFIGQIIMNCSVTGGPSGAVNSPNCTIPSPISVTGPPVTTTLTLNTQPTTTPGSYTVMVTAGSTGGLDATTSFNVNVPAPPPSFTMSSSAVTIASPGPVASSTITIIPGGGFTGAVALSCAVAGGPMGGADAPTCSVTTPPAIVGAAAVTATLTVNTTAATTANNRLAIRNQRPHGIAIAGSAMALASLLLFGFPIRQRRTLTQFGRLLITILIGATMGCGGTKTVAPPANPGTTPGAYTVTVTGSSGSIVATTAVTVTVN